MLLDVRAVEKSYRSTQANVSVLRGIDLQVGAGETLALTGESGSGKSTLLHLIGGLDISDGGTITLDGQELSILDDAGRAAVRRNKIGIIFQQFNLIPSLNIADNIAFQARLSGRYSDESAARLAARLGLTPHLKKYPDQLSGGQQQRVAIARALVAKPKLILADEPTGNLDETTAAEVMAQMLELVSHTGAALVMVTHSPRLADQMDRRLHLRQGRLA
ncbi:MAG: ABC transporter ATP-binding protein [Sulfitobacter sp.]